MMVFKGSNPAAYSYETRGDDGKYVRTNCDLLGKYRSTEVIEILNGKPRVVRIIPPEIDIGSVFRTRFFNADGSPKSPRSVSRYTGKYAGACTRKENTGELGYLSNGDYGYMTRDGKVRRCPERKTPYSSSWWW